jgi:DNA (cytosine-5)-methyltransferase 1
MGKMSFPENEKKPSRTITATKIGTSREAITYQSEYNRNGNGEFRTPTVREAACIMSFPITYQFLGGETTKWRLIGNAVCPSVARAFAKQLRYELKLPAIRKPIIQMRPNIDGINDLNTYSVKTFGEPPRRNQGSRFRRHPLKDGNITVTLSNYDIDKNEKKISKWLTSVQYGNGKGFPTFNFPDGFYKEIETLIQSTEKGDKFLSIINNGFSDKIAAGSGLQEMYEKQKSIDCHLEPTSLIEEVAEIITFLDINGTTFNQGNHIIFKNKEDVPVSQLLALYAINKITTTANSLQ